ncbi:NADAR domain-containing protein [Aphelenchoides besseyi]|nr:NADAR domain-containing protein [Aphelenchoides besseyi]
MAKYTRRLSTTTKRPSCTQSAALNKQNKSPIVVERSKQKKYAKETLANHGISSRTLNEWKQTDGLLTLIYAVALKFIQNPNLRELLFATSDKLLVQTHDGDNFYASGTNAEDLEAWIKEHEGEVLKVPCNLVKPVLKYVPLVAKGQNLLGFINMKVRQELLLVNPDHLQDINVVNTILMKLTS